MLPRTELSVIKDILNSVGDSKVEIHRCEWRIKQLKLQAECITPRYMESSGGGTPDPHKDSVLIALADEISKLKALKRENVKNIVKIEKVLDSVENPKHKVILELRYCECMSWPEIQLALPTFHINIERARMFELHNEAIRAFRRAWEKKYGYHKTETRQADPTD